MLQPQHPAPQRFIHSLDGMKWGRREEEFFPFWKEAVSLHWCFSRGASLLESPSTYWRGFNCSGQGAGCQPFMAM